MKINNKEMKDIIGGSATYTSALNTLLKGITALFGIGQAIGNMISKAKNGGSCSV